MCGVLTLSLCDLQPVTATLKALSRASAKRTVAASAGPASSELDVTCVRRTTSTTAQHRAASSVPPATVWSETR